MISEWQSLWPNREGKIGSLQALQWLVIGLLLSVYVTTYFRVSLGVVFKIFELKGVGRTGFHVVTSAITVLLYWRLKLYLQRCMHAPCVAMVEGKLPEEADNSWKMLLGLNGVCVILPAFAIIYELLLGRDHLSLGGWSRLLLLLAIGGYSFRLAAGAAVTSPTELPSGKVGGFTQLVISASVWSNGCFLLSSAAYMPYYATEQYQSASIQHAAVGALMALFFWQLKGVKWPVLVGLAISLAGGPTLGEWLSRGVAVGSVFLIEGWRERNATVALVRAWGFGIGQSLGRLVGGLLGTFYLGLDGGGVGLVIGEALAATIGFQMVAGSPASTTEPSEEPAPEVAPEAPADS